MKVLFLDVDGVLNTSRSKSLLALGKGHLRLLEQIVKETECKIVVSSSWRKIDFAFTHLIKKLAYRNIPILSKTASLDGIRGEEIQLWLSEYNATIEAYAILDDDSDMLDSQLPHFFQTDMDYGLTKTIAYRVIYHLNGKRTESTNNNSTAK